MRDFSSALYLGLRHASRELAPWSQLTLGAPAALAESGPARLAASRLARLAGRECGALARSSLHAMLDLLTIFADARSTTILIDAAAYAVSQWSVQFAVVRGVGANRLRHYEPEEAWRAAERCSAIGQQALIVLDGSCPGCGRAAPLTDYLDIVRQFGGRLVIDDTQAFGLAGPEGGGSLRALVGEDPAPALLVASLAKGFGAPLAFVAGSSQDIARYERRSQTRVHLSPPSMADVNAALHAVQVNAIEGTTRRRYLDGLIRRLQRGVSDLVTPAGLMPVQQVPTGRLSPMAMHQRLLAAGVRGVLHRGCDGRARLSLIVTAMHTPRDIDEALRTIWRSIQ